MEHQESVKAQNKIYLICLIVLMLVYAFFRFFTGFYMISGNSMYPTYHNGQIIKTTRSVDDNLQKGSVVIAIVNHKHYIKRVIATGGDTITIQDNKLYVNDEEQTFYDGITTENQVWTLEDNQYFLVGDNFNNSKDSRVFGPVSYSDIIAVVLDN
jgi:signal peptidase I